VKSNSREIEPVNGPVDISITPPGSKSITNRALLCAALASGVSRLTGVLDSDDTRVMIEGLRAVGADVVHDKSACTVTLTGIGEVGARQNASDDVAEIEIDVEGSGTTIRFLTAALTAIGGSFRLDGIERMRSRPIGDLVDALKSLGGVVSCAGDGDCPPVVISSSGLTGGTTTVGSNISSQYLSGLLMAAPLAKSPVVLTVDGELVSRPYVEMTISVMQAFGVKVEVNERFSEFRIQPQTYAAIEYAIEPDASAASYFWAAAAICGGTAEVHKLTRDSLQGDVGFVDCLEKMGCEVEHRKDSIVVRGPARQAIDVDMGNISDTVQTLSAVALFVPGTTKVTNIAHNRVKETDRIGNLVIELKKLGIKVDEREDGLTIHPAPMSGATFATYDDHRMAMSFALIGLGQEGIKIENPSCVSKTYPRFFEDLASFLNQTSQSGST